MRTHLRIPGWVGLITILAGGSGSIRAEVPPGRADAPGTRPGAAPVPFAFVQVPTSAEQPASAGLHNTLFGAGYLIGSRIVQADPEAIGETMRVVSDGFASAADPAFSPGGKRMTFAGPLESAKPLQIWEIEQGNASPMQRVMCGAACVQPVYLARDGIAFASLPAREYEEHGKHLSFSLYAHRSGTGMDRLTFKSQQRFRPPCARGRPHPLQLVATPRQPPGAAGNG